MSLTKATYSMITGTPINVLDYIPQAEHAAIQDGTSTYNAGPDIQAAINVALSESLRVINGVGTLGFPAKMQTVLFPQGVYNTNQTLEINSANYAVCRLEGQGRATIRYTLTGGGCIYAYPHDPNLALMTAGPQIVNLMLWKDNSSGGSVGLVIERMTNCYVAGLSIHGFDYGIQVLGGINNEFDFQMQTIEYCNYGMLIEQETAVGSIIKPNLTIVRNGTFSVNSSHAILIRRNPGESLVGNSSGSVITIADCLFQSNSAVAIVIESPGEAAGNGTVNVERCWFEPGGITAIQLATGQCKVSSCYITNTGTTDKPFLLMDNTSTFIINELDAVFGAPPVNNFMVQRADGTTNGIAAQIVGRRNKLLGVGIPSPLMGPQNTLVSSSSVYSNQVVTDSVISSRFSSLSGTTASLAAAASEAIFQIDVNTGSRTYIVTCRQFDGGQVWRGIFYVQGNSAGTFQVTTVNSNNVTLTGSGSDVLLTNSGGSAMSLVWNAVAIGS